MYTKSMNDPNEKIKKKYNYNNKIPDICET